MGKGSTTARILLLAIAWAFFSGLVAVADSSSINKDDERERAAAPHVKHEHQHHQNHARHDNNNNVNSNNAKPQGYGPREADFDVEFRRFLRDNGYTGGSVAAVKDGRLLLAKGYGVTREGTEVKVGSRSPVSGLSRSLTAVAVLRLAQEGKMSLEDPVFGQDGILEEIRPLDESKADPRISDITVGHLLRHSAGWDQAEAPLFDPVLNELYQAKGYSVPDIAKEMDAPTPLDPTTIIRYTLSRPLSYTPGTRVVTSNVGYLILGRVVERVSRLPYQDYVKKTVLNPCGMWHTRLGNPAALRFGHRLDEDVPEEKTPLVERNLDHELTMFDVLDPLTVDSALGWFSTVYDMARFARCVFDSEDILSDGSLEVLLERQDSAPVQRADSWLCAGFHTNTRGAVWQDGDPHADDAILYHDLLASRQSDPRRSAPDTWVVLLHGSHLHHLRHKIRDLMRGVKAEADSQGQEKKKDGEGGDVPSKNGFVSDLSDINAESSGDGVLVKFRVDEHHLDAYLSAVKLEDYTVRWISPYTVHGRTTAFSVISRLPASTADPEVDFRVEHGLGEKQLLSRKLGMEAQGYNLTFLQSYFSHSHADPYTFLAVFRKHAYSSDTQLKYGTDHLPEPYDKLVQMYHEKQFHPLVQSVLPRQNGKEEHLSFVFLQTPHSKPVDFKTYYRLGDAKLERTVLQNGDAGRTMTFLDTYTLQGKTRFAAVFSNETKPRWHFQGGLTKPQATLLMEARLSAGLWPSLMVGYADKKEDELKYAVFLRSDEEDSSRSPSSGPAAKGARREEARRLNPSPAQARAQVPQPRPSPRSG